ILPDDRPAPLQDVPLRNMTKAPLKPKSNGDKTDGSKPRARPEPLSLRSHRPFVLFWFARTFASVALQMQVVAVGWQVYELTGSALDLGLVGLAQFVPA